jgi:hypothetical protein
MVESGEARTLSEVAERWAYVSRMVNLTTLAPDVVAAILDETLPPEMTPFDLAARTRSKEQNSPEQALPSSFFRGAHGRSFR